jgi:hypothetical protein
MKRIALAIIFCLLVTFDNYHPGNAHTPFAPLEDTIGYVFLPDTPLNGVGLFVDYTYNEGVGFGTGYRAYLKFDLNNLTNTVDASVKVRLYTLIPALTPFGFSIYSVDDGWGESTLTWNNSVAHPPLTELDRKFAPTSVGGYMEFTGASLASYINTEFAGDKIASFVIIQSATCPSSCGSDVIGFADSENTTYPPQLDPSTPTGFIVGGFTATPEMNFIHVQWTTGNETELLGFNLYRASSLDGEHRGVNSTLIDSRHPGTALGDEYSFDDVDVQPGKTYYYWLELKQYIGFTFFNEIATAKTNHIIFLPVTFK